MARPLVVFVVGTRPDAIKTAPVVKEFLRFSDRVETRLISTGQHKEMLAQALGAFGLTADVDFGLMTHGQTLAQLSAKILDSLDPVLGDWKPAAVFAQGDTTTTFVASLAAFYRQIPFFHIEAGLRTESIKDPFPEEFNRRATGLLADLHFAPTAWSRENLLAERVAPENIFVTGNTGIDAVKQVAQQHQRDWYPEHGGPVVLLTTHRRENWGAPQEGIAQAVAKLAKERPGTQFVVAMHKNPAVRETLVRHLQGIGNVDLIEPPDYADFVKLMERMTFALTDSGGVQEEAPAFGKPVLVLRKTTERPEGVTAGTAKLVGTDPELLMMESAKLLDDSVHYASMSQAVSPYGDGRAAQRIRFAALRHLGITTEVEEMWA